MPCRRAHLNTDDLLTPMRLEMTGIVNPSRSNATMVRCTSAGSSFGCLPPLRLLMLGFHGFDLLAHVVMNGVSVQNLAAQDVDVLRRGDG